MERFHDGAGTCMAKECAVCGESFQTNLPIQITCGKKCSRARRAERVLKRNSMYRYGVFPAPEKPERECDTCGKKFVPARPMYVSCGKECARIRNRTRMRSRAVMVSKTRSFRRNSALKKTCAVCGDQFQPRSGIQVTCGNECSKERRRTANRKRKRKDNAANLALKKECAVCGDQFQPRNVRHITCGGACARIRNRVKMRDSERRIVGRAPPAERECAWCHGMFKPRTANQIVCGKKCSHDRVAHKAKEWFRAHYGLRPLLEIKCGWCGGRFQTRRSGMLYCGMKCSNKKKMGE